jgi:predicted GH43/DUF377 family glycosyl hydrolase
MRTLLRAAVVTAARAAVVAAAITACSPGPGPSAPNSGGSPGTPSAAGGSPGAGTSASPDASVKPEQFVFDPEPVVSPETAGLSSLYVNPGALIDHDGTLHMFPNLFSTWPGRVEVPHLTSTDGITWTPDPGAADLSSDDFPMANPGIDVSTGFVADDGTWVLIFETVSTSTPWTIGRASAPSPQGPWTVDPEPVVEPGEAGTWSAGGVHWPSVVRTDDGWSMYFAGFETPQGGSGGIGLATSTDGVAWQARSEPVFIAAELWEGRSLDRPRVVRTPDGLVMVYAARDLTDRGIATSQDGVAWTRLPGPVIERDLFPIPGRSWDAALLYRDAELVYFLEVGLETTDVFRATLPWRG